MFINKIVGKKRKVMKMCQFPECDEKFDGIGPAKYCAEHRKPKYRTLLNKALLEKKKELLVKVESSNQDIKHSYSSAVKVRMQCSLDGCDNEYEITLFPRTFIYPKFCELHRNPHKRQIFTKLRTK